MDKGDAPTFQRPDYKLDSNSEQKTRRGEEEVPAPPFSADDYEAECDIGPDPKAPAPKTEPDTHDETSATSSKSNRSHKNSTAKLEGDKSVAEKPNDTSQRHHIHFTSSAKNAASATRRRLHVHRETGRGPSEARQRRQSSIRTIGTVEEIKAPFWRRCLNMTREVSLGIWTMLTTFAYWDMAFWSGWSYTWGSVLFVIDGAWAWTPLQWPSSEFAGEAEYGVGLLFFFGALLYQLGAAMAYLEAINDGSFAGPAMRRLLEGHEDDQRRLLDDKLHAFFGHMIPHHHSDDEDDAEDDSGKDLEKQHDYDTCEGWAEKDKGEMPDGMAAAPRRGGVDAGPTPEGKSPEYITWRWYPTRQAFLSYHIRQVGYVACSIQLLGATLYAICGVVALPGVLSSLTEQWKAEVAYWIPQTVASVCFFTAGVLFTYETQEKWNRPLPGRIAWWVGVWATIGSTGFLLSAVFGVRSFQHTWCGYQSSLASMWGSFAYLVSSALQWYESINKGPVLAFPNNRTPAMLRD